MSQSAFAGYGLEDVGLTRCLVCLSSQSAFAGYGLEAIEELSAKVEIVSQSAFAGYGLEGDTLNPGELFVRTSQSAFAGYGLEESLLYLLEHGLPGRNPLSLDMGWKQYCIIMADEKDVAIRFRWIWVGSAISINSQRIVTSRNPLSLDMGWKSQSSSMALANSKCRNPLSLDMGWK